MYGQYWLCGSHDETYRRKNRKKSKIDKEGGKRLKKDRPTNVMLVKNKCDVSKE